MSKTAKQLDLQLSRPRGVLPNLAEYLQASISEYEACMSEVRYTVSVDAPQASIQLNYVKFNLTDKEPKFDVLASVLAKHVVRYSLSVKTRESMKDQMASLEEGDLLFKARDYFRKHPDSGEVGELLLFFLLEAAFGAPQVVCKMELKTNAKDEVKGSDGIHVKWDEKDGHLDVYIGESKLHQGISGALKSVFESLTDFYEPSRLDEELHLVTPHFKYLDSDFQKTVTRFVNRASTEGECHIIHACLIGWDWPKYKALETDRENFFHSFEDEYKKYASNIQKMLNKRFAGYKHKHLTFKFVFIPFKSVGDFRRAFYKRLCGVDIGPSDD